MVNLYDLKNSFGSSGQEFNTNYLNQLSSLIEAISRINVEEILNHLRCKCLEDKISNSLVKNQFWNYQIFLFEYTSVIPINIPKNTILKYNQALIQYLNITIDSNLQINIKSKIQKGK